MPVAVPDFWVLFKVAGVFVVIILALRLRLTLGFALLISSVFIVFLFGVEAVELFRNILRTVFEPDPKTHSFITVELIVILYLISLLELLMRKAGIFDRMISSASHLLSDKRKAAIFFPILLGVLPSFGGARFSAPMLAEATKGSYMKPVKKAFANYWFRHFWEPILPLYPGLLLASAITGVAISSFVSYQWTVSLFMIITGWFVAFHKVPVFKEKKKSEKSFLKHLAHLLEGILPILFVAVAVFLNTRFFVPAMFLVVVAVAVNYRIGRKDLPALLKKALSLEIFLLIFGVMYFKNMLDVSGAINQLSDYFLFIKINPYLVIFAIPFIVGLLTGVVQAYVGIAFPLVLPFIMAGSVTNVPLLCFAFISGYCGVLLSPVHLCYLLSCEYFEVEIIDCYPYLLMLAPALPAISFALTLLK